MGMEGPLLTLCVLLVIIWIILYIWLLRWLAKKVKAPSTLAVILLCLCPVIGQFAFVGLLVMVLLGQTFTSDSTVERPKTPATTRALNAN